MPLYCTNLVGVAVGPRAAAVQGGMQRFTKVQFAFCAFNAIFSQPEPNPPEIGMPCNISECQKLPKTSVESVLKPPRFWS